MTYPTSFNHSDGYSFNEVKNNFVNNTYIYDTNIAKNLRCAKQAINTTFVNNGQPDSYIEIENLLSKLADRVVRTKNCFDRLMALDKTADLLKIKEQSKLFKSAVNDEESIIHKVKNDIFDAQKRLECNKKNVSRIFYLAEKNKLKKLEFQLNIHIKQLEECQLSVEKKIQSYPTTAAREKVSTINIQLKQMDTLLINNNNRLESSSLTTNQKYQVLKLLLDETEATPFQIKNKVDAFEKARIAELKIIIANKESLTKLEKDLVQYEKCLNDMLIRRLIIPYEIDKINKAINIKRMQLIREQERLSLWEEDLENGKSKADALLKERNGGNYNTQMEVIKFLEETKELMGDNKAATKLNKERTEKMFVKLRDIINNNIWLNTEKEKLTLLGSFHEEKKKELKSIEYTLKTIKTKISKIQVKLNCYRSFNEKNAYLELKKELVKFNVCLIERKKQLNDEEKFIKDNIDNIKVKQKKPDPLEQILVDIKNNKWSEEKTKVDILKQKYGNNFVSLVRNYRSTVLGQQNILALIDWLCNSNVKNHVTEDKKRMLLIKYPNSL